MVLQVFDEVIACRDIRRYRTTVARSGALGIIVARQATASGANYTVEFRLPGVACAAASVPRLSAADIVLPDC